MEMRSTRRCRSALLTTIRRKIQGPSAAEHEIRLDGPGCDDHADTTPLESFPRNFDSIADAFLQVSADERESEAAGETDGVTINGNPLRDEPHPVVINAVRRFGLVGLIACALFAGARRWLSSLVRRFR
jgi:hypothetical protein